MNNNNLRPLTSPVALVLFLTAFLPVYAVSQPTVTTDILFVAYDQGESNAFIEIQKQLDKEGISYRILAMGRARDIFAEHPGILLTDPKMIPDNHRFDRSLPLDQNHLAALTKHISAPVIYSGMASVAQAQIINELESEHRRTIAFYDNFDPLPEKEYTQPFLKKLTTLDEFHVPSQLTANSFENINSPLKANVVVTGQPALTGWDDIFIKTSTSGLRTELGITDEQQVIVFAGGYDGDYPESFKLFAQATQELPDTLFLVTHHPKYDGKLEKDIINTYAKDNVRLIQKGEFTTAELCTISSAVIVHKSTIAQQAIYKGIPALYIASEDFSNLILENNLAARTYTVTGIRQWINKQDKHSRQSFVNTLGVPEQPVQLIADRLKAILLQ